MVTGLPVSGGDAGEMSLLNLQHCCQQPWKEPGVKASHVLSEPISSVNLAAVRQRAAVMLRTNSAES